MGFFPAALLHGGLFPAQRLQPRRAKPPLERAHLGHLAGRKLLDQLQADQPGTFQVYPAGVGKVYVVFVAEFNQIPSQCTGRFRNVVDGSFLMMWTR